MTASRLISEKFVARIFDKRYEEADAILREQREAVSGGEIPRLVGVEQALRNQVEQLGAGPTAQRGALAGSYMLASRLRDWEYWPEAEAIYREVIGLSLAMKEVFFLDDARLS